MNGCSEGGHAGGWYDKERCRGQGEMEMKWSAGVKEGKITRNKREKKEKKEISCDESWWKEEIRKKK